MYAVLWVGDLFRNVWHQNSRLSLQLILGCLGADVVCCMGCWLVSCNRRAVGVVAVGCLWNSCCSMVVPSGRDMSLLLYTFEAWFSLCTRRRSLTNLFDCLSHVSATCRFLLELPHRISCFVLLCSYHWFGFRSWFPCRCKTFLLYPLCGLLLVTYKTSIMLFICPMEWCSSRCAANFDLLLLYLKLW